MAGRCLSVASNSNGNICSSTWDLQGIYRHKGSHDIVYDGKRIRWHNDYESLQKFIEYVFAQTRQMEIGRGNFKKVCKFYIADLSCTWYPGKLNYLIFHGETGDLANEIFVTVCKSTSFNSFENSVKECIQNIPELNSRDIDGMTNSLHTQTLNISSSAVKDMYKQPSPKYVDQSSLTVGPNSEQCLCVDLVSEFDNIKINFEIILTRIDALQSLANTQAICFGSDNIVHQKCLKDHDAILNQPPIVIPHVPIVSSQSPIVPPQAPITPSSYVNKQNLDQSPELQIPCHVSKEFLNKLPLCDTQGTV